MKKGFIFSMDAFFAIILFTFVLFLIYIFSISFFSLNQQYFYSEDILTTFSEVKLNELDLNNYQDINDMISSGKINTTESTIIEQITDFYLLDPPDEVNGNSFINDVLSKIDDPKLKKAIFIGESKIFGENIEGVESLLSRSRLALGKK